MLPDLIVLFQMFCGLCLSLQIFRFWPCAVFIDEKENSLPSVGPVPVRVLLYFRSEYGFDCMKNLSLTVISVSFALA
jgi:hypothetical protein